MNLSRARTFPLPLGAFYTVALLLVVACGSSGNAIDELSNIALSDGDVPSDWQAADIDEVSGRPLWDVMPDLLTVDSEVQLLIRAYEDEDGLHGTATILIQAEVPGALPQTKNEESVLGPLANLVMEQDALLVSEVTAGDPGAYFAASEFPLPDSVRSRLVRLIDDGYLYSDSVIFSVGPVLAVVTVWYPEEDGPFRDLEELADLVEQRMRDYVGDS